MSSVSQSVISLRAVVGDLVDGALGALALPHGAGRLDEALLLERLDHGVERAVIETDALLLGPLAAGSGPPRRGASASRTGRPAPPGRGGWSGTIWRHTGHSILFRVICKECSETRLSGVLVVVKRGVNRAQRSWSGCPTPVRLSAWTLRTGVDPAESTRRPPASPPPRRERAVPGPQRLPPRPELPVRAQEGCPPGL